jgi:hypothetical protein
MDATPSSGLVHVTLPSPLPMPLAASVVWTTTSPVRKSGANVAVPLLRNQNGIRSRAFSERAQPGCAVVKAGAASQSSMGGRRRPRGRTRRRSD